MPIYTFEHRETGEQKTEWMSDAERVVYLKDNPQLMQIIVNANGFIGGINQKPDDGFRDILREIKRVNPRNTIDTM
jgi:hypothetical protein